MQTTPKKIGTALGSVLVAGILAASVSIIMAFPVKWLWNWVMVDLFYLEQISVLQAWGLAALSSLLFKPGYKAKD